MTIKPEKLAALTHLIETVHRLRAPNGCAWDRAQTHQSLRPYLIEEAYEVLDVLDQIPTDEVVAKDERVKSAFREELGDVLMQVLLHSEMANERGAFDIYDVAAALDDKLIRRHPHVFSDVKADSEESAFQTWEKQKAREKAQNKEASILDGLPKGLPALQRASRINEKVTKVGFQWKDLRGPVQKIEEELSEVKHELAALEAAGDDAARESARAKLSAEIGDLLFTVCNLAYLTKVTPEDALRSTIHKFESRFRFVERKLKEQGKLPEHSTLEEMDALWNEAKKVERG